MTHPAAHGLRLLERVAERVARVTRPTVRRPELRLARATRHERALQWFHTAAPGGDVARLHVRRFILDLDPETEAGLVIVGRRTGGGAGLTLQPAGAFRLAAGRVEVTDPWAESAARGAYLDPRAWRRIGHFEVPPDRCGIYMVSLRLGGHTDAVLEVPPYIARFSLLLDSRLLAHDVALPLEPVSFRGGSRRIS